MMQQLRRALWFVKCSWSFLGCDRGTGRWKARRRYLIGLPQATARFLWLSRHDEWSA